MFLLRVELEMAKYRISQRTIGSIVQGHVNDVRGLFLGNHRDSPWKARSFWAHRLTVASFELGGHVTMVGLKTLNLWSICSFVSMHNDHNEKDSSPTRDRYGPCALILRCGERGGYTTSGYATNIFRWVWMFLQSPVKIHNINKPSGKSGG